MKFDEDKGVDSADQVGNKRGSIERIPSFSREISIVTNSLCKLHDLVQAGTDLCKRMIRQAMEGVG